MQALVVNPPGHLLPPGVAELIRKRGWDVINVTTYEEAIRTAGDGSIGAVIVAQPQPVDGGDATLLQFNTLVRLLHAQRIAGMIVTNRNDRSGSAHSAASAETLFDGQSLLDFVDRESVLAELRGRLAVIEKYHALVLRMERELSNMQRLGRRLNRHFTEVDQEMRLAGRLQRDFLPKLSAPIGGSQTSGSMLRFAAVFRPASWVSGDLYDVFRIDENNTGFYVIDAVGHGLAASLLTMFIKRAIVSKHVHDDGYTVLTPSQTMAALNDALADQSLPNCQFVTACYAVFNHSDRTLRYARGGHPYPVLIDASGAVSEIKSPGGLLGIFRGEEFPTFELRLHPGDKVLVYTDGVELAFSGDEHAEQLAAPFHRLVESCSTNGVDVLIRTLEERLDREAGSIDPRDDVTIVGLEVLPDDTPTTPSRTMRTSE